MTAAPDLSRLPQARRLLFTLLWLSYAWFYQSGGHNEAAHFDTARALAQHRTFSIDEWSFNSADTLRWPPGEQGSVYSTKAPGLALLATPVLALSTIALHPLGLPAWIHWHVVCWLTTLFTVGLLFAFAGAVMFDTLARVLNDPARALVGVLSVWLGSIAFPFATLFFSHAVTAALLALSFAILLRLRHGLESSGVLGSVAASLALAGVCAGWAPVCEYPAAILSSLTAGYAVLTVLGRAPGLRERARLVLAFILPASLGPAVLLIFHKVIFGSFLFSPYRAMVAQGEGLQFPGQKLGMLGIHWPGLDSFLAVLREITFRPQRGLVYLELSREGLFATAPVLLLAVPGIYLLWHRKFRAEALLAGFALVAQLAFNCGYGDSIVYWGGGASVGPRHLVAMLPFLAFPLAVAVGSRWRWLLWPLLAVSVFYMLLATAVEPRVPYEVNNPPRDFFLPRWLDGDLSMCRAGLFDGEQRFLTDNSVAGGLGKMIRLPGEWQLAPLLLLWLLLGLRLVSAVVAADFPARSQRSLRALFVVLVLGVILAPPLRRAATSRNRVVGGWNARIWGNDKFTGEPLRKTWHPRIDFNWDREPPLYGAFSVEWRGDLQIVRPGHYSFRLESDDGSWLELDGALLIDNGGEHGMQDRRAGIELTAGTHRARVRYFNAFGGSGVRLWWTPPSRAEEILPAESVKPD